MMTVAGDHNLTILSAVIMLLPVVSFLVCLLFFKKANFPAPIVATTAMGITCVLSFLVLLQTWKAEPMVMGWSWIAIGETNIAFSLLLNDLTGLIAFLVTLVSFLVHLFSVEYMARDRGINRYFGFLGLFTTSMLGIVFTNNLLIMFIFWELVGLSSYLLIGFWFEKEAPPEAARKAFLVNRIGDLGFLLGILLFWDLYGTLEITTLIDGLIAGTAKTNGLLLTLAGLGLFCGAIGKSAQFPLQVWLPDAMEGPTPVSALIHAATMVAAGIFMLARVFTLLTLPALNVIAVIGALTAFMGAFAALQQNDIKKVLAFSTVSQLGYMVMGIGVGAWFAAVFHLVTHAFFKACFFLGAGSVIHAMEHIRTDQSDPQDMRNMGGLRKLMPTTFITYTFALGALAGLPFFSGFLSKDAILSGVAAWTKFYNGGRFYVYLVPILGFGSALLTVMYMGRQWYMVFFGKLRLHQPTVHQGKDYSGSLWMKIPLIVLGVFSFAFVFSMNPFDAHNSWISTGLSRPTYLFVPIPDSDRLHLVTSLATTGIVAIGSLLVYLQVFQKHKAFLKRDSVVGRLSADNFHLDALYDRTFVAFFHWLKRCCAWLDQKVIDPLIDLIGVGNVILGKIVGVFDQQVVDGLVKGVGYLSMGIGQLTRKMQPRVIHNSFIWLLLGILLLGFFMIW